MNHPSTTSAMTPRAAPTPIPAFAPVERPPLDVFEGVLVDVGLDVADVEEEEVCEVDWVKSVVDDDIEAEELVTAPWNIASIVCRLASPASSQQSVVSPQHHTVDVLLPSQGVTRTSSFCWSPLHRCQLPTRQRMGGSRTSLEHRS